MARGPVSRQAQLVVQPTALSLLRVRPLHGFISPESSACSFHAASHCSEPVSWASRSKPSRRYPEGRTVFDSGCYFVAGSAERQSCRHVTPPPAGRGSNTCSFSRKSRCLQVQASEVPVPLRSETTMALRLQPTASMVPIHLVRLAHQAPGPTVLGSSALVVHCSTFVTRLVDVAGRAPSAAPIVPG